MDSHCRTCSSDQHAAREPRESHNVVAGRPIESSTTTLTGPLVEGGLLLARSCLGCKSQTLRLTAQTRLFIGEREVTLAELNKFLQGGGKHGLGIGYDRTERTVTRLVVFVKSRRRANSRH